MVLTALAPRRGEGDSDPDGMVERVAAELGVTPGKRYHAASQTNRPRTYEQAVARRTIFDAHYARFPLSAKGQETTPFYVGGTVLCRGQLGTVHSFASGVYLSREGYASSGGVTVAFEVDGGRALADY